MNTFLPYPNFAQSAQCLDYKRLGKQRVETLQILNCLLVKPTRWQNHGTFYVLFWENFRIATLVRAT